uniref:AlNc14C226G9218 protein n=1 Tax=Albugo laibachii Nc14 TaxID=890382 RepID=F0WS80_9STRA|nr:AlNc14C226G9218 [Albugo laibachii Nc14]|eukprot:CCA24198.1 AlNc14C226G9218 [Albugo laibachii Nc14]
MTSCSLSSQIWSLMLILVLSHANPDPEPKPDRKNYILTEAFPLLDPYKSERYDIAGLEVNKFPNELKEGDLCLVLTNFSKSTMDHLKIVVKSIKARVKSVSVSDTFRKHVSSMKSFEEILRAEHLISYSAALLDTLIGIGGTYNKYASYNNFASAVKRESRIHLREDPPSVQAIEVSWELVLLEKSNFNKHKYCIYTERIQ